MRRKRSTHKYAYIQHQRQQQHYGPRQPADLQVMSTRAAFESQPISTKNDTKKKGETRETNLRRQKKPVRHLHHVSSAFLDAPQHGKETRSPLPSTHTHTREPSAHSTPLCCHCAFQKKKKLRTKNKRKKRKKTEKTIKVEEQKKKRVIYICTLILYLTSETLGRGCIREQNNNNNKKALKTRDSARA